MTIPERIHEELTRNFVELATPADFQRWAVQLHQIALASFEHRSDAENFKLKLAGEMYQAIRKSAALAVGHFPDGLDQQILDSITIDRPTATTLYR